MEHRSNRGPLSVAGVVSRILHGSHNETCGVLLDNGNIVLFPPHYAKFHAYYISPGQALAARGYGIASGDSVVIAADAVGASLDDV